MLFPSRLTLEKLASSSHILVIVFLFLCCNNVVYSGGFLPGTLIRTFEGRYVPIQKLDLKNSHHNLVLSANFETKVLKSFFCYSKVKKIGKHAITEHVEITVNREILRVDKKQQFFRWIKRSGLRLFPCVLGKAFCHFTVPQK